MIDKYQYDLLVKSLDPQDGAVDRSALASLLDESSGFDDDFATETASKAFGDAKRFTKDGATADRVSATGVPGKPPFARYAIAAVTFLAVALVGLIALLSTQTTGTLEKDQIAIRTQQLPDGSTVDLAPGSRLVIDGPFADTRSVRLTGEAYFSVESSDVPFIVHLDQGRVTVTGTEFNVRSWPDELAYAEVSLFEGSVQVEANGSGLVTSAIQLVPGQSVRLTTAGTAGTTSAPDQHVLAWRSGGFGFNEVPVSFAFKEVERRFGVVIEIAPNVDASRRVTYLSPRRQSLDAIMTDLCHALSLQYRSTRGGYEVFQTN